MKKLMTMLAVFAMAGLLLNACKGDDDDDGNGTPVDPTPLTMSLLKANDSDLNGATSAKDVAVGAVITSEFSTDIDATTANDNTVLLVRTFDNSAVAKTIAVSGKTITITPTNDFFEGDSYKVSFTNGLKSTEGAALTALDRTFGTVGIGIGTAPQSASQFLYLQFTNDILDLTGNAEKGFTQVTFTEDRFGNANSAAKFGGRTEPGTGDIVELEGDDFIAPSMTLSVWFYIDQADYAKPAPDKGANKPLLGLAGNNGYLIEIGDGDDNPNWIKLTTNHDVNPINDDPLLQHDYATQWGDFGTTDDGVEMKTLLITGWHHLVMTFDAETYTKTDYLDGVKIKTFNTLDAVNNEWNLKDMVLNDLEGVQNKLTLGYFASKDNTNPDWALYPTTPNETFKGYMDDLRLFSVALSAQEVTSLYDAEKVSE